jgi:PPP family 3-phenylpropionic acid transporter
MPIPPASSARRLAAWYFFYFAYIGAFAPYFALYLQGLDYSPWEIGVLMSVGQAMRLFAPPLWGWLADHIGKRAGVVRASAVLSALGFGVFFVTIEFWGLFLGLFLMSFFWSAALPLVEALTLDHLRDRAERYGRIRLWGSVGFIAAVVGVGAMLDRFPLSSLLGACFAFLLGIVACAMLLRDAAPVASERNSPALSVVLRHGAVLALLAASFFMSAAHGPFYVFFSIHLDTHGYDKSIIGILWSLGVIAEIGVFVAMPRLLRRFSLRGILLASFVLAVLRFLIIGWEVDSPALLLLAQLAHGATFGAHHAAGVAALNRWFAPQQRARVLALYGSISFGAGGMLGNLFSGQAWGSLGPEWTFTLGAACALIGGLVVAWGMKGEPAP